MNLSFYKFQILIVTGIFKTKQGDSNEVAHLNNTEYFFLYKYCPKCGPRDRYQISSENQIMRSDLFGNMKV